jgi:very-short-patch-repair endonuclease
MLDEALYRRWLTVEDFVDQVHAVHGQRGAPALRALLRGVGSGARSAAERLAQQVLARSGIEGWTWNHPVALPDGTTAVLDAALAGLRIAIEIDGRAYHSGPREFQHDRTRQNALVAAGWIVLRFTWFDLTRRPDYVVAAVRAAVRSRGA